MKHGLVRFILLALAVCCAPLRAHIGSPAVVFDGAAGPYPIRVIVRPAPVVPGRAEIDVRLLEEETSPVQVTVLPVNWRAGLNGAPTPDEARPVKDEPALRHAELWLMTSGSYSVHVTVTGARGSGTAIVPVLAVATRQLPMSPWLGALLTLLGVTLVASAIALVGAGVRDSVVLSDETRTAAQRLRGRIFSTLAAVAFAAALFAGKGWWDREDQNFRTNQIYQPRPLAAEFRSQSGGPSLALDVPPAPGRSSRLLLIPDHGKLMHLFLIREPQLDALAHLHPARTGPHSFTVPVPPLPPGRYRLYADITNETGFAATLTTTVELPALEKRGASRAGNTDPDDSWFVGAPGSPEASAVGLAWAGPKDIRAGEDITLRIAATDRNGRPLSLEPYMGMLGHAAVRRVDGAVFAHLHPVGTISMASQALFVEAAARQTGQPAAEDHSAHLGHGAPATSLSFPYLFPEPGPYRIWVQTKANGSVVTGVFDVTVAPKK